MSLGLGTPNTMERPNQRLLLPGSRTQRRASEVCLGWMTGAARAVVVRISS